jgi:hypothetical protein
MKLRRLLRKQMKVGDKGKSRVTILTQPGFVRRIQFDIPKEG